MADLFLLSEAQMRWIERYFPRSHGDGAGGRPADRQRDCVCDQERTSLARRAARLWPAQYDRQSVHPLEPPWGVQQDFRHIGAKGGKPERILIDATDPKAHRTAASLLKKGLFPDVSGVTWGGLNSKLHRGLRRSRTPARHAFERRADKRLQGRGADAGGHAKSQAAPRISGAAKILTSHYFVDTNRSHRHLG